MDRIESLLNADDRDRGSFGAVEKGVGYATLVLMIPPILLLPLLFALLRKCIYKLTVLLLGYLAVFFAVLRFRFSWIVWFHARLQRLRGGGGGKNA